jgi:hypothetical protein
MTLRVARRSFLRGMGAVGAGLVLGPAALAQGKKPAKAGGDLVYTFVNKTNGKFTDEQIFWSLNGGQEWHSIAKEPKVPCPGGNGRMYFYMGTAPKNFDDYESYWDFIEYAYGGGTWNGNTTQVDAFCIPLTIELGDKKVGITESRKKLFETFREKCPKEFKECVKGDFWIVSPPQGGF